MVYIVGNLNESDKESIREMVEHIRIKEKYELLAKRIFKEHTNHEPEPETKTLEREGKKMTNEEAIHCMKSYLPEDTYETCMNCKYYGDECKSNEAHYMAIKALESQLVLKGGKHAD